MNKCLAALVFLCLFSLTLFSPSSASAEVLLGILPRLHPAELREMFTPLAEYLSKETGEKFSLMIPRDFDAFKTAAQTGQMDFGFANPLVYVQLRKAAPAMDPLGLAVEGKGGAKFRGIFIARKDSGIGEIKDLRGKKLIFVDEDSAAGYIFASFKK